MRPSIIGESDGRRGKALGGVVTKKVLVPFGKETRCETVRRKG